MNPTRLVDLAQLADRIAANLGTLSGTDLSPLQLRVLLHLREHGPTRFQELAQAIGRPSNACSNLLATLRAKGLTATLQRTHRNRSQRLTTKGHRVAHAVWKGLVELAGFYLAEVPDADQAAFERVLDILLERSR